MLSAALATVTERIDLRAGSVVLPHHHPVRVAEEWALVDQLSGGRVGLCLATGWHKNDFVFFPQNYDTRREYTFEHLETLRRLWRGDRVMFPGPDGQPLPVVTYPRPTTDELPLWLVHSTNPRTWTQAGQQGTNVLTLLDNWSRLAANIERYREARAAAGLDPSGGTVTVGLHTYVTADDDEARRTVEKPVKAYLSSFLTQRGTDAAVGGSSAALSEQEQDVLVEAAFEDTFRQRSLLGSPERCRAVVSRLADIGVTEVACLIDFGLPFPTVMRALPALDELRASFAADGGVPASAGGGDLSWYYRR
ncbi:MupA/Atu3671 family FMN-dependent luciferase-like monooxygenase [Phytohabitans flavus]|uniref:MupA/Atu3671 family FMN-dependent luciferase-like monooxygenase n=1 Tax=Phytohabitans flavus TaxID=1076124 RepID=UPI0036431BF3